MQRYKRVLFWNRVLLHRNTNTKPKKKSTNGFLAPKDQHPLPLFCHIPYPTPLSTMNTRQPGLRKFTSTVHSCHSCWGHCPGFKQRLLCSTTPHARRERMEAALKMKDAPQGRASKREQKGTPCTPGRGIRAPPHVLGLLRQVSYQG